jgi:hypothetical protein
MKLAPDRFGECERWPSTYAGTDDGMLDRNVTFLKAVTDLGDT